MFIAWTAQPFRVLSSAYRVPNAENRDSATTLGGGDIPSKFSLTKLRPPDEFNKDIRDKRLGSNRPRGVELNCESATFDRGPLYGDWWTSATKPDEASTMFVVGGTLGLVICAEREGTWFLDFQTEPPPRDDVMSVDWLDRSTFISGDRSGKVRLYDTRHKGTSLRIVSPSSATHVKRMYEHSIVVAGNRASNVCFAHLSQLTHCFFFFTQL